MERDNLMHGARSALNANPEIRAWVEDFLKQKAASADGPAWFRALYAWLNNHPVYEDYFYRKPRQRLRRYDGKEIASTS